MALFQKPPTPPPNAVDGTQHVVKVDGAIRGTFYSPTAADRFVADNHAQALKDGRVEITTHRETAMDKLAQRMSDVLKVFSDKP